jgi:hypothetical protein
MRKTMIAAVTALSLLGGCTTAQVTDFLKQVQAASAQACLFVPTIDTILSVATSLGIAWTAIVGGAIKTVAGAICSQVPPPASDEYRSLSPQGGGPAKTVGILNDIPINGWRTH